MGKDYELLLRILESRALLNANGTISTENSVTGNDPRFPGQYYNFPTIWGGKQINPDDALVRAMLGEKRGQFSRPSYGSIPEAEEAAQLRSQQGGAAGDLWGRSR
jgi:hypothetical protein